MLWIIKCKHTHVEQSLFIYFFLVQVKFHQFFCSQINVEIYKVILNIFNKIKQKLVINQK